MAIFDDLAARDPNSLSAHKDRLIIRRQLMELAAQREDFVAAAQRLDQELEIQSRKTIPQHEDQAAWISEARFLREVYRLSLRAIGDAEFSRLQPPQLRNALLQTRAIALAKAGRAKEAGLAANELLNLPENSGGSVVAACAYSLILKSLAKDDESGRAVFLSAAIDACEKAIQEDRSLIRRLMYDPYLDCIRDDPQFQLLMSCYYSQ